MEEKEKTKMWSFYLLAGLVIVVCILCYYILKDNPERGTFGDMFGSVNALFSGIALAGIIFTIYLQKEELRLQRLEIIETRKELKRSAEAQEKAEKALLIQAESMKVSAELEGLSSLLSYYWDAHKRVVGVSGSAAVQLQKKVVKCESRICELLDKNLES